MLILEPNIHSMKLEFDALRSNSQGGVGVLVVGEAGWEARWGVGGWRGHEI